MRKICIALSKGGVAKSSTAVSLAHGLSMHGKKVLLVDTDDQGQDAFILGFKPKFGLAEVLSEEVSPEHAICEMRGNLWVLAGGRALSGVKRSIGRKDFGAEQTLSSLLRKFDDQFDFVIVDTSPSWDTLTINALFYCDEVLSPISLEVLSLNSLAEFSERIKSVQSYHKNLKHKYLVPTFWDRRVKKSSEILKQLEKYYPGLVCNPVRYCVRISECSGFGKTIFEYAASSSGAQDYLKIVKTVMDT